MKKFISVLAAMLIAFSAFSSVGFAEEMPAVTNAWISQPDEAEGDADRVINWYEISGVYYMFIPASIDYEKAVFEVKAKDGVSVFVDGIDCTDRQVKLADVFADKSEVTLTAGNESFKVMIIDESKTASMFIVTESGSLDFIHAQKGNEENGYAEIVDANGATVYDDKLEIKGRGNSTWGLEKKPYNIKLEEKTNLFDMGKSKKWSLIANHGDASLIRNSLAYAAAENAGLDYAPKFEPVDVYINNNYMGSYLLTTRVEIDKTRVNIDNLEDLNEEANPGVDIEALPRGGVYGSVSGYVKGSRKWFDIPKNPENVTGGYIIELELPYRYTDEVSGFVSENGQAVTLKSPEFASKAEADYIADYYQAFESALHKGASLAEIAKYCNIESFAKSYIFNEWVANHDAGLTSTYLYKPANDTLYLGPVWDFDSAFGNMSKPRYGIDYTDPNVWTVCHSRLRNATIVGSGDSVDTPTIYNLIAKNKEFTALCKNMWDTSVESKLAESAEYITTEYAAYIEGSAVANAIRWNIFDTADVNEIKKLYSEEIKKVADFAKAKTVFIDGGIGEVITRESEKTLWDNFVNSISIAFSDFIVKIVVLLNLENKI